MISGDLTVHSVHQITGEEVITGELRRDGARPIPFTSTRGDSVKSLVPEIAAELERQVRAFDRQHDAPVETVFRLVAGNATLVRVTLATLWPAAHARMLVERVQASRITRAAAIARITPAELAACGALVLDATSQRPIAQGLAASPGTAVGRLALPVDVESATDSDPRVLVIDDATPKMPSRFAPPSQSSPPAEASPPTLPSRPERYASLAWSRRLSVSRIRVVLPAATGSQSMALRARSTPAHSRLPGRHRRRSRPS